MTVALARGAGELDFEMFKNKLEETAEYIVLTMRDHIFKEDNILYPAAKEMLKEGDWDGIRNICDDIGYTELTPEESL